MRTMVLYSILCFFSCFEEDYPLDNLDSETKYHLIGLLKAGESPTFQIQRAFSASRAGAAIDSFYVKTGYGILFENNQIRDTIVFDVENEVFILQYKSIITAGNQYSVTFFDKGSLQIESEKVEVPKFIPDFQITLDTNRCIQGLGSFTNCELSIYFEDAVDIVWEYLPSPTLSNSGIIEPGDQANLCDPVSYRKYQILPGSCLGSKHISYYIPFRLSVPRSDIWYYDQYRVELNVVSASYLEYLRSLAEQDNYSAQLFIEPSITYSNMIQGLGILGAARDTMIDLFHR